jgi:hypothetical protein
MSRQEVIRQIVARELKRLSLAEEAVMEALPELHAAACELFGTWETALRYAGIHRRKSRRAVEGSRECVLRGIRELCWKGYKPTMLRVKRDYPQLYHTARLYFETWESALQAAGIDLENSGLRAGKPRCFEPDVILAELRLWHAAGRSLRWRAISLENRVLAVAAKRTFGSWRKVISAAGLFLEKKPSSDGE